MGQATGQVEAADGPRSERLRRFDAALAPRPWSRDMLRRRLLAVADALSALFASSALGLLAGSESGLWSALFLPGWILLAKIEGLYDRDHRALRHLTVDEIPQLVVWTLTATATLMGVLSLTPAGAPRFAHALVAWLASTAAAIALRGVARATWRAMTPMERTLIVGDGPLARVTRRKFELFTDMHAEIVGQRRELPDGDLLPHQLAAVDRLVLASPTTDEAQIARLVAICRSTFTKLSVVPPARGLFGTAVQLEHVADLPVVEYNTWDVSRSTLLLKRALDVTISLVALIVLAPLFMLVAAAIKLVSPGPVFFAQSRAGLGGRPFRIRKFRTMVSDAEARLGEFVRLDRLAEPAFKLEADPRVTGVGRVLRRTSLDELPQLANVLRGDMSLVGPRPEQVELVERYSAEHRFRLAVKPGLTGPMQVYGRGQLTFEERLAVEREYIENLSLGRDLRILFLTFSSVLTGRGAF